MVPVRNLSTRNIFPGLFGFLHRSYIVQSPPYPAPEPRIRYPPPYPIPAPLGNGEPGDPEEPPGALVGTKQDPPGGALWAHGTTETERAEQSDHADERTRGGGRGVLFWNRNRTESDVIVWNHTGSYGIGRNCTDSYGIIRNRTESDGIVRNRTESDSWE